MLHAYRIKKCTECVPIEILEMELEFGIPGVDEIRYLEIFIVRATSFRGSFGLRQTFLLPTCQSVLAKIGRLVSAEEVILR